MKRLFTTLLLVCLVAPYDATAKYVGDFTPGKTIRLQFNTYSSTAAPITLAGSPSLKVYKDNGTAESTSGLTLSPDFDSVTGLHNVAVNTSADGTFYSAGSEFSVVLAAGTVDGTSVVGTEVGSFSLSNRSALRPTTADRTLAVSSSGVADANVTQFGGTNGSFTAGVPAVNSTQVNNSSTAAVQLAEAFDSDGTGGDMDLSSLSVTGTTTYTGDVTHVGRAFFNNGVIVSRSDANSAGVEIQGAGVAPGLHVGSGSGATADAVQFVVNATNGDAVQLDKAGTGVDLRANITGNLSGSVSSVTGAVGSVTGNVGGNVVGSVASVTGNVGGNLNGTVGSIAAGGITSNSFAADAITAAKIAADVVTEFQTGLPLQAYFDDLFENAPTFAEAMDDHGYTTTRAEKIDDLAPSLLVSSAIDDTSVTVTQTSFALADGPSEDDALNGAIVIITDVSNPSVKAIGLVKDYDGSTETVTLVTDPGIFTFADGDAVDVIAAGSPAALWLGGSP